MPSDISTYCKGNILFTKEKSLCNQTQCLSEKKYFDRKWFCKKKHFNRQHFLETAIL